MCTTNIYTHVHSDGRRSVRHETLPCHSSRSGRTCANHIEVYHPAPQDMMPPCPYAPSLVPAQASQYHVPQVAASCVGLPPTPVYTPRPSSHGSGSESGRLSPRRSSPASSSRPHSQSPSVMIYGQRYVPAPNRDEDKMKRESSHRHGPPHLARTPPQSLHVSSPPSPLASSSSLSYGAAPRESHSRPHVHVQINQAPPPPTSESSRQHARPNPIRSSSQQKHHSQYPSSIAATAGVVDAERRRKATPRESDAHYSTAKANAKVDGRYTTTRAATSGTGRHKINSSAHAGHYHDGVDPVVDAMGKMSMNIKRREEARAHQKAIRLEQEEMAAQEERLRERLTPRHGTAAEVGHGGRWVAHGGDYYLLR